MTTIEPLRWVKSSYSDNGGTCVEWAPAYASATGVVPVRDSKSPAGPALMVSADAFAGLVALARSTQL
ncbi:DUF397 domain-containing protein [Streptomyces yaizuensis]|uniref:DUF397 domain-containing protein n=1 Tax=Streptomyces yaizuensis TaxID=2989713 RepID=A0ABQ5NUY5_9ACTN|nr:DUF397 domain-containing protein [Streptomyces sp. YSPA8]GLF94072.1 DUF397 domain-containing protein [Streptomyces sp. YSPA8]